LTVRRWQMNRAGLFNFWHYEDQEFQLEEGRLILRGANGSGKSVTMQSFLPLVLDGDKRPNRLDPFGSRDRKIEYYLLGDADSDTVERTGYIWMEFVHPEKKLYKTIGIGIKARRGTSRIHFWGFLLDDGRRVNKNFWLYDRSLWLAQQVKQVLDRRKLEENIGSGGKVVHEQAAYRDLVNKSLFGFRDAEAYQDLLQLMIQLRSPKLSKDFKPSSIYEILTQALPPLMEDELRPLSEVLEDMDQIADHLDEISRHRQEMSKLQTVYDKYNRYLLMEHSRRLLRCYHTVQEMQKNVSELNEKLEQAVEEQTFKEQQRKELGHRLQEIDAELEVIYKSEAIGKQQELATIQSSLKEADENRKRTANRISHLQTRILKAQQSLDRAIQQMEHSQHEQHEQLERLEEIARETELIEHDLYHRMWHRAIPEDDRWLKAWHRDVVNHRSRLEKVWKIAQKEREWSQRVLDAEQQLSEARKKRDQIEHHRLQCEQRVETEREALREQLVQWKQSVRLLRVPDETLHQMLEALDELDREQREFSTVKQHVVNIFTLQQQELVERRLDLVQKRKQMETESEKLIQEKATWESSREPEPARSEARKKARSSRPSGTGAPLYEVCEFVPGLDDEMKARVEDALEKAGLLDAWIAPDGQVGQVTEDEEEVWIVPAPVELGYTLADILKPTPSAMSGLDAETIDVVLRTFLWEETDQLPKDTAIKESVIGSSGSFRIGPLLGKGAPKERAEYIGKETRRRTRELQIQQLATKIANYDKELDMLDDQLAVCRREEAELSEELNRFPADRLIQKAWEELNQTIYHLRAALAQEEEAQARFKKVRGDWRHLQQELVEQTSGWSRLKQEEELHQAVQRCRDYESLLSLLHAAWRRYQDAEQDQIRWKEAVQVAQEDLEQDEEVLEEQEERVRSLKAQTKRLRSLMEELGISDVITQIEQLKEEKERLRKESKGVQEEERRAYEQATKLSERLRLQKIELERRSGELEQTLCQWNHEMQRNLVQDWQKVYKPNAKIEEIVRLCKEVERSYGSTLGNRTRESVANSLLEGFNAVRHDLADYALTLIEEKDSDRLLIFSMRDRSNPQPPGVLLEELNLWEAEQRSLLSEKDRELYEEIILRSVGKAIRQRIQRAERWVAKMNRLMAERNTSSGLQLKLEWVPKLPQNESQLNTERLVHLLKRDAHRLLEEETEQIVAHFRSYIGYAKQEAQTERESLRKYIYEVLDYRNWFQFVLYHRKGDQVGYRELTDSKFNVLSGGEKAMAMYIPLFAAISSRYMDAKEEAPKIISLDEAFAGVDEENMRDMFQLLTEMGFDYMMTSQVLWGCYDVVPNLAIYEIYRPKDADVITLIRYHWNGHQRTYVEESDPD
jgi:uncharacterized protein (TIGR02680 family)